MRWLVVILAAANLALAGYIALRATMADPDKLIVKQQLNADQIRIVPPRPATPAAAPTQASANPPPQSPPAACIEWDGVTAGEVEAAQAAIDAMALGDRVRKGESPSSPGYWVYIPPGRTRAAMDKKVVELKERGVADFAPVLEAGRWRYAISLGWFRNEDGARTFLASLREKGVRSAQVIQREQRVAQTHFLVRDPTDAQAKRLNELKARFPATELRVIDCPPA